MFLLVTLFAHQRMGQAAGALRRQTAWYHTGNVDLRRCFGVGAQELWTRTNQTFYGSFFVNTVKVSEGLLWNA